MMLSKRGVIMKTNKKIEIASSTIQIMSEMDSRELFFYPYHWKHKIYAHGSWVVFFFNLPTTVTHNLHNN